MNASGVFFKRKCVQEKWEFAGEAIAESVSEYCPAFGEEEKVRRTRFFELLRRFHFPAGIQEHVPQLLALADSVWQPEPKDEREADGDYWWKRCRRWLRK